ncbi:hypothetical protein SAMN05216311_101913 [Chitinophaga sp. CF418]|nr:hypothetical protein SAMN05216311_101913 [Chitinophaga sp. CF418]
MVCLCSCSHCHSQNGFGHCSGLFSSLLVSLFMLWFPSLVRFVSGISHGCSCYGFHGWFGLFPPFRMVVRVMVFMVGPVCFRHCSHGCSCYGFHRWFGLFPAFRMVVRVMVFTVGSFCSRRLVAWLFVSWFSPSVRFVSGISHGCSCYGFHRWPGLFPPFGPPVETGGYKHMTPTGSKYRPSSYWQGGNSYDVEGCFPRGKTSFPRICYSRVGNP